MALTTPILNSVAAWDVNNGQTFTFNVIGGDLVNGNKLTDKDGKKYIQGTYNARSLYHSVLSVRQRTS